MAGLGVQATAGAAERTGGGGRGWGGWSGPAGWGGHHRGDQQDQGQQYQDQGQTTQPTTQPSGQPAQQPTGQPTQQPTGQPTGQQPTGQPAPAAQPTTTQAPQGQAGQITTEATTQSSSGGPESQLLSLINNRRQSICGSTLRSDDRLAAVAREHNVYMATTGKTDHGSLDGKQLMDRFAAQGYSAGFAGENVVRGTSTAQGAFDAWDRSTEGHKELMESCETVDGGIAFDSTNNLWTLDVGRQG
ncbi:MAG TPA: CAP domain-containing protein [Mycobacteriales bacterium]